MVKLLEGASGQFCIGGVERVMRGEVKRKIAERRHAVHRGLRRRAAERGGNRHVADLVTDFLRRYARPLQRPT